MEYEYRRDNSRLGNQNGGSRNSSRVPQGEIAKYKRYRYGGGTPKIDNYDSTRSVEHLINDPNDLLYEIDEKLEELEELDERMFNQAGITLYDKAYIASNDIDVSQLDAANKLAFAAKLSVSFLPAQLSKEVLAIFKPATVASMAAIFAVYIAAHATGIGQAVDIGMLIAGGVFFGMDAFTIFKDIAGFANAVNAQNEDDLEIAGQHLASAVAKVGVDAIMTLLTSKVAKKIAGMEEPGTTTGDMDDVNRSIRRNRPTTEQTIYDVNDIGNEISKNPVARQAYQRINDQGVDVILTNELPDESGTAGRFFDKEDYMHIKIYESENFNLQEAVGTLVHESNHVDFRLRKRKKLNSQYEEFRAFVREEMYKNSLDPETSQIRPPLEDRYLIWEDVKQRYPTLREGKYPFGGSK